MALEGQDVLTLSVFKEQRVVLFCTGEAVPGVT